MFNNEASFVKGHKGKDIPFKLLSKDKRSKNLAIILPGAGYTSQAPLLYYSTSVFINKSFDVLQVNYHYNNTEYKGFSEIVKAIKLDVKNVLDYVLSIKTYDNFYLIGKSLGTIPMSTELNRETFKNAKAIWLTPLLQREDVLGAMMKSEHNGLCIIGDRDPCYTEERYLKVVNNSNITSKLISNVNHSLGYEEKAVESIDVLREVIKYIDQF